MAGEDPRLLVVGDWVVVRRDVRAALERYAGLVGRVVDPVDYEGDYAVEFLPGARRDPEGSRGPYWNHWHFFKPRELDIVEPTEEIEARWLEQILMAL